VSVVPELLGVQPESTTEDLWSGHLNHRIYNRCRGLCRDEVCIESKAAECTKKGPAKISKAEFLSSRRI
jgi:hypothetical protein